MLKMIAIAVLLLATGALDWAKAQDTEPKFRPPYITVDGNASAEVKPDTADLSLGVVDERPTASEAVADNAKLSAGVVADLKSFGIDAADIRTEALNLTPIMIEERDPKTGLVTKRTITGYRASLAVRVRLRDVSQAGAIVSHVVERGANTFHGLSFRVSDESARIDALRAKAVADAMKRATLYARGASMKLGRLLAIEPDPDRTDNRTELAVPRMQAAAPPVAVPVEPGTETLSVHVRAAWELLPE